MKSTTSWIRSAISVPIALVLIFSYANIAQAGLISADQVPTITINVDTPGGGGPPAWSYSPALEVLQNLPDNARGRRLGVERAIGNILGNRASVVIQELAFDPDPFVLNTTLLTNTTNATQIYTVGVALPTVFGGPNIISGSITTQVIDGGNDGATVAALAGGSLYSAQIDGSTVATLQSAPFSVVAPVAGVNNALASFGPSGNATAVASDIGVLLRFSLTAGDSVSVLSRFDVVAIPEPGSLALTGLAMFGAAGFGRRRR